MTPYNQSDIVAAVWGATLLASGGGGDIKDALNLAYRIPRGWDAQVFGPQDSEVERATTVGLIGTPRQPWVDESTMELAAQTAVDFMLTVADNDGGGSINAILPTSVNPMNIILAFWQAYHFGLYVGDCDGAGRGTSSLATLTYSQDMPVAPISLASASLNVNETRKAVVDAPNAAAGDSLVRSILASPPFYGYCATSVWRLDRQQIVDKAVWGSIDAAKQIGRAILTGQSTPQTIVTLLQELGRTAKVIASGTLTIEHEFDAQGLTRRRLRITSDSGKYARVYTEKESMTYWDSFQGDGDDYLYGPHYVAPDSICLWDNYANKPLTDFDIPDFVGMPVSVIWIKALGQLTNCAPCVNAFAGSLRALNYGGSLLNLESDPLMSEVSHA